MSSSSTKVVPVRTPQRPTAPAPAIESPGNWTHPRLREINRRRNRSTFNDKNVRKIAYNIAALIGLWILQWVADQVLSPDSGSIASKASFSGSPLSARGSVNKAAQQHGAGSPYSPAASPLNGKSGFNPSLNSNGRRSSFGSPVPLSNSASLFSEPATPSPSTKKTSVGLNNKWLYEKGRRSSGSWMQ
ncbi:unnamed protein product [Parascedosporium putredinis]|uniref:Nuclear pore complex component n=1 Tax=Parascedosporium putredinis TaxID=1442378 RepID=A0A9P1M8K3_9PEZI|nr:unnamed protein product [Parascedosporium putredinis]CAI7992880.1 unnamed protein product [Parascedosporium putredinis]